MTLLESYSRNKTAHTNLENDIKHVPYVPFGNALSLFMNLIVFNQFSFVQLSVFFCTKISFLF